MEFLDDDAEHCARDGGHGDGQDVQVSAAEPPPRHQQQAQRHVEQEVAHGVRPAEPLARDEGPHMPGKLKMDLHVVVGGNEVERHQAPVEQQEDVDQAENAEQAEFHVSTGPSGSQGGIW